MKRPSIPKFIKELYNPTMKEWLRWLRFRRKAIAISKQGMSAIEEFFQKCAKGKCPASSMTRSGMYAGSSSGSQELEIFPWAWMTRRTCFLGTSISLSSECHNSDIRTIAYVNDY